MATYDDENGVYQNPGMHLSKIDQREVIDLLQETEPLTQDPEIHDQIRPTILDKDSELIVDGYLHPGIFIPKEQIILLKGPMGMGKTTALQTYVQVMLEANPDTKFLMICPTKSLISKMCVLFDFASYLNFDGKFSRPCSMVITPNSFWKLKHLIKFYDVLIFEEVEGSLRSLAGPLIGPTLKTGFCGNIDLFYAEMLKDKRKKLILIDALIQSPTIDFFLRDRTGFQDTGNFVLYHAVPEPTDEFKTKKQINYFQSRDDLVKRLFLLTRSNNKEVIMVSFSDRTYMETLATNISNPPEEFLREIDIDPMEPFNTVEVVTFSSSTPETGSKSCNAFLSNPAAFAEKHRIIFHTSVIQSGVSIDFPAHVYMFASNFFAPDTSVQMMGRVRNPINGINMHISKGQAITKISEDTLYEIFDNYANDKTPANIKKMKQLMIDNGMWNPKTFKDNQISTIFSNPRLIQLLTTLSLGLIKVVRDPLSEFLKILNLDSEHWKMTTIKQEIVGKTMTTKDLLNWNVGKLKSEGKLQRIKNWNGIVQREDYVLRCINDFNLCGKEVLGNFDVDPKPFQNGFDDIKAAALPPFCNTFGFGSHINITLAKYATGESEERTPNTISSLYKATLELLIIISQGKGDSVWLEEIHGIHRIMISDPRKFCEMLMINNHMVIANYWILKEWFETYSAVLVSLNISLQFLHMKNFDSTYSQLIVAFRKDIISFLQYLGISFSDTTERNAPCTGNKLGPKATKLLKTFISEVNERTFEERNHGIPGVSLNSEQAYAEGSTKLTRDCHTANLDLFQKYFDVSIRKFRSTYATYNNVGFHPCYSNMGLNIADYSREINYEFDLAKEYHNRMSMYCNIPSYWLRSKKLERESSLKKMLDGVSIARFITNKNKSKFPPDFPGSLHKYQKHNASEVHSKFKKWIHVPVPKFDEVLDDGLDEHLIDLLDDEKKTKISGPEEEEKKTTYLQILNDDDDDLFLNISGDSDLWDGIENSPREKEKNNQVLDNFDPVPGFGKRIYNPGEAPPPPKKRRSLWDPDY
jgi:DNA polymerase III delta prime subunit